MANYQFPRDEFDDYETRPTPVGVHRAPRSTWNRLWPFLLVAALFSSVAIAAVLLLTRPQEIADVPADPPYLITDPANGNGDEPQEPAEPADNEYPEAPDPAVNYDVPIRVLNDTGPSGEAGRGRDRLADRGFTNVVADNFPGDSGLTASTVWYTGENHDSAVAVAEALGIPADRVTEHAVTGAEIAVIVRGSLGL